MKSALNSPDHMIPPKDLIRIFAKIGHLRYRFEALRQETVIAAAAAIKTSFEPHKEANCFDQSYLRLVEMSKQFDDILEDDSYAGSVKHFGILEEKLKALRKVLENSGIGSSDPEPRNDDLLHIAGFKFMEMGWVLKYLIDEISDARKTTKAAALKAEEKLKKEAA